MTVLLAEVALRVLGLPAPAEAPTFVTEDNAALGLRPDTACFWRLAGDVGHWYVNANGLRGPELRGPTDESTFRIACAGDSCTFGIGVTYEQTYGVRLESAIRARLPHADVQSVLGATPAFTSHQTAALYEQEVTPLRPDLTVIYCGAWNDYQPKIGREPEDPPTAGLTDREIADRLRVRSWSNLLEAFRRALANTNSSATRRVPLADFEQNLARLTELAQRSGEVILVVPPVRADTRRDWPMCTEYQDAVRRLGASRGLRVVDGPAIFAACEREVGPAWTDLPDDASPMFVDGAHPSPFGHSLIADGVLAAIDDAPHPKLARLAARPAPRVRPSIDSIEPRKIPALLESTLELRGAAIGTLGPLPRVWVGDVWAPRVAAPAANTLRITVPPTILPGSKDLVLMTPEGPARLGSIEVEAPRLEVGPIHRDDPDVEVVVHGIPGRGCGVYLTPNRIDDPIPTLFGLFELGGADRPNGFPQFPPSFPQPAAAGLADAEGSWRARIPRPSGREDFFVQGLVMATDVESQDDRGPIGSWTELRRVVVQD
ncbi:MAG: SGNH/GDSL hydrolase family protein [Planctomycetes bacterium]|nr:SGNH/GDSL hydrolase family protein [Planctomycetota bacterium]